MFQGKYYHVVSLKPHFSEGSSCDEFTVEFITHNGPLSEKDRNNLEQKFIDKGYQASIASTPSRTPQSEVSDDSFTKLLMRIESEIMENAPTL